MPCTPIAENVPARAARSLRLTTMFLVVALSAAGAQERDSLVKAADANGKDAKKLDASSIPLTFTVPESPAFTFLGVSPAKVTRASTPRDLGAALINSVDSTGKVLNGVAITASLWTLLQQDASLTAYQTNPGTYALANSVISIGTVRAAGNDSTDTNIALGLRTTFIDHSDIMRNPEKTREMARAFLTCLREAKPATPPDSVGKKDSVEKKDSTRAGLPAQPKMKVEAVSDSGETRTEMASDDPRLVCAEAKSTEIRKRWFKENWNKPALSWGMALGWRAPGSEFGTFHPLGVSTWLAGALPIGTTAQLLTQVQFDYRNARDTIDATSLLTYGARAVRGGDTHNFFLEVAGTGRFKSAPGTSRSNVQWSGGVEFKIAEGYWLSTGFGKRYTEQDEPDQMVIIANVRWGISNDSRLKLLPGVK